MRSSIGLVCPFPLTLALALPVAAQRTWIVDAGGGGDFTDIPIAVATAGDGDTIRVRPSWSYSWNATIAGKSLRLLGDPQARATGVLNIIDVPAGRTVVVEGFGPAFAFGVSPQEYRVVVRGCAGTVVLERLRLERPLLVIRGWRDAPPPALSVTDSRHVEFASGTAFGGPGIEVIRSDLVVRDSHIGGHAASPPDGFHTCIGFVGRSSRITIAGGRVDGGPGIADPQWIPYPPKIAMQLEQCDVVVTGDVGTTIRGGVSFGWGGSPTTSIVATGGSLHVDPRVVLETGPMVSGTTVRSAPIPALSAAAGTPGTDVVLRHVDRPGATAPIFVSLPAAVRATPFGDLWLDLPSAILLHAGTVPASGAIDLTLPLTPAFPRGLALTFQSASTAGGGLRLSNAATTILH